MSDQPSGTILEAGDLRTGTSGDFSMGWLTGSRGIRTATDESFSGIRVREFSRGGLRKDTRQGMSGNPKRRLRGFLISTCEGQARVGFVQDDNTIVQYLLPEKNLRKAGITAINQPFEMDEIEQQVGDGFLSGYVFRPMAAADAVVTDTFDADDDLAELRNAALRHFRGKAED